MRLGDAFLMPIPQQDCDHLWFVISDPEQHAGTFIIVNITSDYFRAGKECPLTSEDHPWIKEQCFVSFCDAIEITPIKSAHLDALLGKFVRMKEPLDALVLNKIVTAGKKSRAIPVGYKKYL